jgi:hypothetical protein
VTKRERPDTLDGAVEVISRTPSHRPPNKPALPTTDELDTLKRFVDNVPALRKAWLTLANANVEHLKYIKRIERRFVALAILLCLVSLIVLTGIGAAILFNRSAQREAIQTRQESAQARQESAQARREVARASQLLTRVARTLDGFLDAQGATSEAVAKQIQAEVSNDSTADHEAVVAAVEAERKTLKARREVAEPHERVEVERRLERVERKARAIRKSSANALR